MAVWSSVSLSELGHGFRFDAEYYRPDYQRLRHSVEKSKWPVVTIEALAESVINFGAYSLCNDITFQELDERESDAVEFITARDIQDGFIDQANARWIPAEQHHGLLWKSKVQKGQVLVAMAARLGHASVYDGDGPLNSSQDIAKITVRDTAQFDPYYVAAFINSALGRGLLIAAQTGSVQQHTNLGNIKSMSVVQLPRPEQLRAATFYKKAIEKRNESGAIIAAAEARLMEALGLNKLDLSPQKTYARRFKDLNEARRFGAEYFMPCKQRVLDELRLMPHRTIAYHAPNVRDMWDPKTAGKGEMLRNFDLTAALEPFLDDSTEPLPAEEMLSAKKRIRSGDVVISRLRSYLQEIAVVRTSNEQESVGSSEFIVLRPTGKGLSAETLMIYLRCPLIQTILKWSQDGSAHPRFTEEDLVALPVPDKLMKVQKEIDGLVNGAIAARREAAHLLGQAKRTVESLIAGGEEAERR